MSEKIEKEKYEFGVEIKKMLKLMIHSLYTNKDVAIRELISNASDACDKLRYKAIQDDKLLEDDKELKIRIEINKDDKTLSIIDNGIGMDKSELISQLGTIAKSGTENFLKSIDENNSKDIQLIGQFGVGFYSAFMIADKVSVISRKAGKKKVNKWESKGEGEYTIEEVDKDYPRGTRITLFLKPDQTDFLDKIYIGNVIKLYSDHINIPVELQMDDGKYKAMNTGSALWTRPKDQITKEQYKEFYTHIAHMPGEPFMILHNKAEGVIEFTNLIFIPDKKPVDLYMSPDRESKIKLYVKRVFITDDGVKLLPSYLRFCRGIVDSEDLPLNINRESLQYNNLVEKIKNNLTKKILTELEKKMNEDNDSYMSFWNNFGPVIKEGLCESNTYSTEIFNICKFYSSKSTDKMITLNDYIERMDKNQNNIFYISGDSIKSIENSPQMEGFKEKNIEVLYLLDTVDNFWVTVQSSYKGKIFKSITRGDIDIDDINDEKKNDTEEDKEIKFDDDKEKKEKNVTNNEYDSLLSFIKEILKDKIHDVKISKKLTSSPVCLSADETAMDIRLERYLLDQNQIQKGMLKNIEINVKHPIIIDIKNNFENKDKIEQVKELINILFDEACILEGEPISDPGDFAKKINKLLEKEIKNK